MFNLIPWRKAENAGPGALTSAQASPLNRFRHEFDALFDRFFGLWPSTTDADWWGLQPFWGVDVDDKEDKVVVRAEAPGFEANDFDIQVNGNMLTIRAEKKQEVGEKDKGRTFTERRLHRSVTLPSGTDPDQIEARYRNGIVEVELAKRPEAQARRITVKT